MEARRLILAEEMFKPSAPLRQRQSDKGLAIELQQVEHHQLRRCVLRELADATFGRVKTKLQCVERERVTDRDDQLAVEQEMACFQAAQHLDHLGKIARQRLAGL